MNDLQHITLHGRIMHLQTLQYQGANFIKVKLGHKIGNESEVRVVFWNKNGLLTAYNNGNLIVGQGLTVSGRIKGIRSFYMDDQDILKPLKYPEVEMFVDSYHMEPKPQPKAEDSAKAEPTLEEIPF